MLDPAAVQKYGVEGAKRRAFRQAALQAAGLSTDLRDLSPAQLRSFRTGGSGFGGGLGFTGMGSGQRQASARHDAYQPPAGKGGPAGGRPQVNDQLTHLIAVRRATGRKPASATNPAVLDVYLRNRDKAARGAKRGSSAYQGFRPY
jgi:hypothetical protein